MGAPVASLPPPAAVPAEPVAGRLRPLQVVLAVGAVLLVSAGAAIAARYGGPVAWPLLAALAGATAALSLRSAARGLPWSAETFAACTAGLGLAGTELGGHGTRGAGPLLLAVAFLLLHRRARPTATWPLAAWLAVQLAVLPALDGQPAAARTPLLLAVALVGLGTALFGRRLVARVALANTAPWWAAGVVTGTATAWTGSPAERWLSAGFVVGAAGGLLLARLRAVLDPLTGPPEAIPVAAGLVIAAPLAGSGAVLGTPGVALAGYLGVLLASVAATVLDGWQRGLFLPVATSAGVLLSALSVVRLLHTHSWEALAVVLVLTAAPLVVVAARRPEDRAIAAPVVVGCLSAATLLALAAGILSALDAAALLTALYGIATLAGPRLAAEVRRPTEATAAVSGIAAAAVLAAHTAWGPLAVALAGQGACTLSWAWRARSSGSEARRVWWAGATQLVLAAWLGALAAGLHLPEAYTLPAAAGLLLAAGRQLAGGPSWPAWGPGLVAAALPSAVLSFATPGGLRPVLVLLIATAAMLAGGAARLAAPLVVGAATAVAVALRLSVAALPWPVTAVLTIGAVLLTVGAVRERSPASALRARLAELR